MLTDHSKKFYRIKECYENHWWSKQMVADAVVKGLITASEYEEITGEVYPE